jgi:hypothetical protein
LRERRRPPSAPPPLTDGPQRLALDHSRQAFGKPRFQRPRKQGLGIGDVRPTGKRLDPDHPLADGVDLGLEMNLDLVISNRGLEAPVP